MHRLKYIIKRGISVSRVGFTKGSIFDTPSPPPLGDKKARAAFEELLKNPVKAPERSKDMSDGTTATNSEKAEGPMQTQSQISGNDKVEPKDKTSFEYENFPNNINPTTKEVGGPKGPEPTRYGDWERYGRVSDF
ncbi:hypothetical protein BB561_004450 [Smittium simulii]|uniref:Succinate dehydrogenase assembly factor 4, mitochondrial n=1 Tax=Smittium simulii TaxID=133385 RepID=A0A2T9YG57_9FUNG|nr:hypothetical protein BB561_004450 [Smittium simulii]